MSIHLHEQIFFNPKFYLEVQQLRQIENCNKTVNIANNLFLEFSCFVNDSLIFNNLLYTQFFFQFLLLSFILLVGMLGSIALTMVVK